MNSAKKQEYQDKYKTVYSLRVRIELQLMGFEPIMEMINPFKPRLKCWRYLDTPEFEKAFSEIMTGGQEDG